MTFQNGLEFFVKNSGILFLEFAFPYADHGPTSRFKQCCSCGITLLIPLSFGCPEIFMLFGLGFSAVMTMPKTSIDKNGNTVTQENKIRMTFDIVLPSPSFNLMLLEIAQQS